ncbi:hypothetical protein O6H91_Y007700 [Diphasiastrum complanatum]|nr:hypothetical protein O6H91_Y007700 [Diphasiastrum complanatum]
MGTSEVTSLKEILMWKRPGMALLVLACGSLVYYHCVARNCSLVSLVCDVIMVFSCSLAILGMLFRHLNVWYEISHSEIFLRTISHLYFLDFFVSIKAVNMGLVLGFQRNQCFTKGDGPLTITFFAIDPRGIQKGNCFIDSI